MFDPAAVAAPLREELEALRVDGAQRSAAELAALVGHCQELANTAGAVQVLAMAHLAAIDDVALEDGTVVEQHRGLGHQRLDAPALVSDQLGVSDGAASSRMAVAVDVATRLPTVHAAMAAGRMDAYRVGIVCEELREASPEVCRQVEGRIEPWLGSEPPAALRRRVRSALGAVDADLLREKAVRARAARSLRRWPGDDPGVDTWMGSFPVEQARSGWAVVDRLAREYVREGRASGVDEARADALMDLIHSRASGSYVLHVAVPADRLTPGGSENPLEDPVDDTLEGPLDDLVTVTGLGTPGETQVRRAWLETVTRRTGRTKPTSLTTEVAICHADTGALLDAPGLTGRAAAGASAVAGAAAGAGRSRATASAAYRPPPALVELVKARDGRCRFPGCTVSAVFCDLDHVRPWPSGPTRADNLMCLCRRHHRVKQTARWRVRIDDDATVTWTDPLGRTRVTLPIDFLQTEPTAQPEPKRRKASTSSGARSQDLAAADDGGAAVWSAREDELAHELVRAGQVPRSGRPWSGQERVTRRCEVRALLGPQHWVVMEGQFHPGVGSRGRRGRGLAARASADEPPPF